MGGEGGVPSLPKKGGSSMGMPLVIDLEEEVGTRKWTEKAKRLFNFDPAYHKEALGIPLAKHFSERVVYGGKEPTPDTFALWQTEPEEKLLHHIMGLYWLDHNISSGLVPEKKLDEARMLYTLQLSMISEAVAGYVTAICVGELRHGRGNGMSWHPAGCRRCEAVFDNPEFRKLHNPDTGIERLA